MVQDLGLLFSPKLKRILFKYGILFFQLYGPNKIVGHMSATTLFTKTVTPNATFPLIAFAKFLTVFDLLCICIHKNACQLLMMAIWEGVLYLKNIQAF